MKNLKLKIHSDFDMPWLQEQLEHWGVEFVDSGEDSKESRVLLQNEQEVFDFSEDNDRELFLLSKANDLNHFIKSGGRFQFDLKLLKGNVGHFILKRKLLGLYSTNINDVFPSIREENHYKIDSHIRSGYYSDLAAIKCFEKGYDLFKVRKIINNMVYFLEYLGQSKIVSRPIELTLAFTDDVCIIQSISTEFKFYLDHILQSNIKKGKENIESLISGMQESCAHLEIFKLDLAGKLGICAYLPLNDGAYDFPGFSISSIEKAPYIKESEKTISNILNSYLNNLDEKEHKLKNKRLPGHSFSLVEINSKGQSLKGNPGKMLALSRFIKDNLELDLLNLESFHEIDDDEILKIAGEFADKKFISTLSRDDVFDIKEILNDEVLLNNFEKLLEDEKIIVKDNQVDDLKEVIKFQAERLEEDGSIFVKGTPEDLGEENITVKGSREELSDGFIKVKGGDSKEVYGEILHVLSKEDLTGEENLKKTLASKVSQKMDIDEGEIFDFIEENIGDYEFRMSLNKADDRIKSFSAFDKDLLSAKDIEISELKNQINGLQGLVNTHKEAQRIQDEVVFDHEANFKIEEDEESVKVDGAESVANLVANQPISEFDLTNVKKVLAAAFEFKQENMELIKKVRKNELALESLKNHYGSELRKSTYAQEKRHALLLKTKDLLSKQIEAKDLQLKKERDRAEKITEKLKDLNSQEFKEQKRVLELEDKLKVLELRLKNQSESRPAVNSNFDLSSFIEIKNKLESALKEKDREILDLKKNGSRANSGGGANILLEQEIFELKRKLQDYEEKRSVSSSKNSGADTNELNQKVREYEHKVKLLQSVNKSQEKEIIQLKKAKSTFGANGKSSGNEPKASKLVEKQMESMKEEVQKHELSVKKAKQENSKLKSENTALKNEIATLKGKLKRAS